MHLMDNHTILWCGRNITFIAVLLQSHFMAVEIQSQSLHIVVFQTQILWVQLQSGSACFGSNDPQYRFAHLAFVFFTISACSVHAMCQHAQCMHGMVSGQTPMVVQLWCQAALNSFECCHLSAWLYARNDLSMTCIA